MEFDLPPPVLLLLLLPNAPPPKRDPPVFVLELPKPPLPKALPENDMIRFVEQGLCDVVENLEARKMKGTKLELDAQLNSPK